MMRFIYVVGCVGVQAVKIGVAADCTDRLSGLQSGCPLPLAMLWNQAIPNAFAAEKALHGRFAAQRVRGEWFDLGLDPVPAVKAALAETSEHLPRGDEEVALNATVRASAPEVVRADLPEVIRAVLEVWPQEIRRISPDELVRLLAGHPSGKFAGWAPSHLNARMRALGLPPVPVRTGTKVLRGYDRARVRKHVCGSQPEAKAA